MPTELEQTIILLKARNELDYEGFCKALSPEIVYEAQDIRHPIAGKKAVESYLKDRFDYIRSLDPILDKGEFKIAEIDTPKRSKKLCLAYKIKEEIKALWILSFDENKLIRRIDITTIYPDPKTAKIIEIH